MFKKTLISFAALILIGTIAYMLASRTSAKVRVSRVFNAPVERVWSNWNDADTMKRWWGPKDYTAPVIKNDFRVGGEFLYSMRSPSGEVHYNAGSFTEIALNKKIVSTMSFANESGQAISADKIGIPGHWPDRVEITVDFTDLNGQKTRVDVTESGIPLIMYTFAKMGWNQQFDKFEKVVQ